METAFSGLLAIHDGAKEFNIPVTAMWRPVQSLGMGSHFVIWVGQAAGAFVLPIRMPIDCLAVLLHVVGDSRPGTGQLKYHLPPGTALAEITRRLPAPKPVLGDALSVGVVSRYALLKSQTALTPWGKLVANRSRRALDSQPRRNTERLQPARKMGQHKASLQQRRTDLTFAVAAASRFFIPEVNRSGMNKGLLRTGGEHFPVLLNRGEKRLLCL
jgi:hypothetical protein